MTLTFNPEKYSSLLVKNFYQPGTTSNTHSMLLFLMEQQSVELKDLVEVLNDRDVVADLVAGKRKIRDEEAIVLADFFGVDASLFV